MDLHGLGLDMSRALPWFLSMGLAGWALHGCWVRGRMLCWRLLHRLEALGPSLVRLWDFPSQWQLPSCREEGIPIPDASGSRSRKGPNFGLNCCRGAAWVLWASMHQQLHPSVWDVPCQEEELLGRKKGEVGQVPLQRGCWGGACCGG